MKRKQLPCFEYVDRMKDISLPKIVIDFNPNKKKKKERRKGK